MNHDDERDLEAEDRDRKAHRREQEQELEPMTIAWAVFRGAENLMDGIVYKAVSFDEIRGLRKRTAQKGDVLVWCVLTASGNTGARREVLK